MLLLDYQRECAKLTAELQLASGDGIHPDVREIARGELDALRPVELISTNEVAVKYRFLPAFGGGKFRFQEDKTPYVHDIHDAGDDPTKRIILVQGNARGVKTTAAENMLLKIAKFGPARGVLWYMHSEPDLRRYVEERVDFFFREHDLEEKIAGRGGRSKWNLKMVDGMPWEWLPANASTTRARSAAFIVADEIDAMRPAIGNAIVTLIRNRQREYGSLAKAYIASHPDRGPVEGIARLLIDSDRRLRFWTCPDCAHLVSPCKEAPKDRRVTWNVQELMTQAGDVMDRDALLDYVEEHVHLTCPFCKGVISNDARLELDRETGQWIGKGQTIDANENVAGELVRHDTAGFIIHAFFTPFVTLGGLAREWVGAFLNFQDDQDDSLLKEVNVKSLGEVHEDPDNAAGRIRDWKETKAAHLDTGYRIGEVPRGVDFLTMMVDVQGNRFEAGVWGWSRDRECWLIDRFAIKQRLGLQDIQPGEQLSDWDVLETALAFTYPMQGDPDKHLMIAKMAVDTGGVPGVTNNARIWASNLLSSGRVPSWRVMLSKGDRHLMGDLYGKPNRVKEDDGGRPLAVPVVERIVNVSAMKRVMARRLDIPQPGPGFVHLPRDIEDRYVRELVSEIEINGEWIRRGANETWDTLIMCEVARFLLAPENRTIDWAGNRPLWATPFSPSQKRRDGDNKSKEGDLFDRLTRLNRGRRER